MKTTKEKKSRKIKGLSPENLLGVLDSYAVVYLNRDREQEGEKETLVVIPRDPKKEPQVRSLLVSVREMKHEILKLVRKREEKACFRCKYWEPDKTSKDRDLPPLWGGCTLQPELGPAVCGWLFGCERWEPREEEVEGF